MDSNQTLLMIILLFSGVYLCYSSPVYSSEDDAEEEEETVGLEPRSKLVAFLLSFFLGGFGADWFYLSRGFEIFIIIGIVKFILISLAGFCFFSFDLKLCKCELGKIAFLVPCLWIVRLFIFLWWVVDWARVLTNTFTDGSGMQLQQDF